MSVFSLKLLLYKLYTTSQIHAIVYLGLYCVFCALTFANYSRTTARVYLLIIASFSMSTSRLIISEVLQPFPSLCCKRFPKDLRQFAHPLNRPLNFTSRLYSSCTLPLFSAWYRPSGGSRNSVRGARKGN